MFNSDAKLYIWFFVALFVFVLVPLWLIGAAIFARSRTWSWRIRCFLVALLLIFTFSIIHPMFLRARKRSPATKVLQELRLIDAAVDQYAIEINTPPKASGTVSPRTLSPMK